MRNIVLLIDYFINRNILENASITNTKNPLQIQL